MRIHIGLLFFSTFSMAAFGQDPAAPAAPAPNVDQSGVLGRVVVAPNLASATSRLVKDEGNPVSKHTSGARIARPAGPAAIAAVVEPMPELKLVLEGAKPKAADATTKITYVGGNFSPRHALLPNPGPFIVANEGKADITLIDAKGIKLASVAAGAEMPIEIAEGDHEFAVKMRPHATVRMRVLASSVQLPFDPKTGRMAATAVASGDYQLAFYLGADALRVHPVKVPLAGALTVEASVSDKEVVTVTAKTNEVVVPGR
jgi:hypothetical protein